MADAFAEQIRRLDRRALLFQHVERARDLRLAAVDPELELLLAQRAPVNQADRLFAEAGRKRNQTQMMPPLHPARRDHRLLGTNALVEIIEDRSRIDQRL